nr:MAG TPA: hypothetical protein [Caudoviricetes sp.]
MLHSIYLLLHCNTLLPVFLLSLSPCFSLQFNISYIL